MLIAPHGSKDSLSWLLTIATILNGAHFMASYRILYSSPEQIQRYKSASIYVPLILLFYSVWSLYRINVSATETYWIQSLLIVTSLYLALHYTGQTWGMMCTMGFVKGIFFDAKEKSIFKLCLRLLVVWQVIWALNLLPVWYDFLQGIRSQIVQTSYALIIVSLLLGLYAFRNLKIRTKRDVPISVIIPFLALYFWYSLIAVYPTALLGVQISHAVQYLIFPMRVEINQHRKENEIETNVLKHIATYVFVLSLTAVFFFVALPAFLQDGYAVYSQVLISSINIHHFYIDGCIWKISNPIVKEGLFSHLTPSTPK